MYLKNIPEEVSEVGTWNNLCSLPWQNTLYPLITRNVHSSFPKTPCYHTLSEKITRIKYEYATEKLGSQKKTYLSKLLNCYWFILLRKLHPSTLQNSWVLVTNNTIILMNSTHRHSTQIYVQLIQYVPKDLVLSQEIHQSLKSQNSWHRVQHM